MARLVEESGLVAHFLRLFKRLLLTDSDRLQPYESMNVENYPTPRQAEVERLAERGKSGGNSGYKHNDKRKTKTYN